MSEKKTLRNIHDAQDALAKAQSAMDMAQQGLAAAETVAEPSHESGRHPVIKTVVFLALVLAAVLVFVGFTRSEDG